MAKETARTVCSSKIKGGIGIDARKKIGKRFASGKKIGSGLVFGKFMPLHEGHILLLNFAKKSCHRLTILVCTLPGEPIPGEIRYLWVKELFPDCNVVHHYAEIPQEPSEHPDFWNIWKESIARYCPGEEFEALFGSEDYGWKMAKTMGIQYIPVNRERDLVPVSGTDIRNDPMKYWKFLPKVIRPYYAKRVCVIGPESTGKSHIVEKLAQHYDTVWVPEYARGLLREYERNRQYGNGEVRYEDIETIARGQIVTEDSQAQRCNRILFCDTDLATTVYWSYFYFGKCPDWIEEEAEKRKYDLYLLVDVDVPWVDDGMRPMADYAKRQAFFECLKKELDTKKMPYAVINGDWESRFAKARNAVDALMNKR
jgi:NadR type nicotinamide-nucleotide adenylyltransferase